MQPFFATLVFVGFIIQINAANFECGQTPTLSTPKPRKPSFFERRIAGGFAPVPNSWPWQVLLIWWDGTKANSCGGTIIANQWILTAAHCFNGIDPKDVKAYVGLQRVTRRGKPLPIEEMYDHPDWYRKEIVHDIKLIKLRNPIQYDDRVQPICLPSEDDDVIAPPNMAWATGWGATVKSSSSNELLEVNVPFVDFDTCVEKHVTLSDHPKNGTLQVCAGGNIGKGVCKGDSGGPLVVKSSDGSWFQHGITSWGEGCGIDYPGVYTRVSGYCDWIESTTNGDAICHKP